MSEDYIEMNLVPIKKVPFHLIPIGTIFNYYNLHSSALLHPFCLKIEKQFDSKRRKDIINAIPIANSNSNSILDIKSILGGYFFYDADLVQPIQCQYIII